MLRTVGRMIGIADEERRAPPRAAADRARVVLDRRLGRSDARQEEGRADERQRVGDERERRLQHLDEHAGERRARRRSTATGCR